MTPCCIKPPNSSLKPNNLVDTFFYFNTFKIAVKKNIADWYRTLYWHRKFYIWHLLAIKALLDPREETKVIQNFRISHTTGACNIFGSAFTRILAKLFIYLYIYLWGIPRQIDHFWTQPLLIWLKNFIECDFDFIFLNFFSEKLV